MKKQHLNVVIQLMIWLALFILQIILLPSWGKFPTIFDDISFYSFVSFISTIWCWFPIC